MAQGDVRIDSLILAASGAEGSEQERMLNEALDLASRSDSATLTSTIEAITALTTSSKVDHRIKYHRARWLGRNGRVEEQVYELLDLSKVLPEEGDPELRFLVPFITGNSYLGLGSLEKAIAYGLDALKEASRTDEPLDSIDALNMIGEAYRAKRDPSMALDYYRRAYAIAERNRDSLFMARLLNNRGIALSKLERFDAARTVLETGYEIAIAIDSKVGQARLLTNLGFNEKERGNYLEALSFYKQSLKIKESLGNDLSTAYTLNDIGEALSRLGQFKQSLAYSRRALNIATKNDALYYMRDMSRTLAATFALAGIHDSAYLYQYQAQNIADSIFKEDSFREIARLERSQELQQKALENELLAKENEAANLSLQRQSWVAAFALALGIGGLVIGFLIWRAGRTRKRLMERLEARNQALDAANEKLHHLLNEQDSLFNIVTHDLKGPLTNAQRLLAYESEESSEEEKKKLRSMVQYSVGGALDFITEFNVLHEIEKSSSLPPSDTFDLTSLIQEEIAHFSSTIEERKLTLHFNKEVPVQLSTVQTYLRHIVHNLISNAIKYSDPKGSVFITITKADTLRLSIEDQGVGIAKQDQGRIFERFYRGDQNGSSSPSNGLGLSLVALLVEKLGGSIRVNSDLGSGAEFIVQLPL
ncbi:MAG: tetratricopeptide repeat-containing sensor histidine kinase [Cryomorphaceae bacterium]